MTGDAPINVQCPDCGVWPVDGYQTHLRACPHYRSGSMFPMPEMDYGLKHGKEAEKEPFWASGRQAWWREVLDSIVWRWRHIQWDLVIIAVVAIAVVCVMVWLGLEGLEAR